MIPLVVFAATAAGTLVSEDLTAIAVGLAVREGTMPAVGGIAACAAGILAGDVGLWLAGRVASAWPPVARLLARVPGGGISATGDWIERHTCAAIVGSRLVPGARLPVYLAAGATRRVPARVFAWMTLAVAIWTPALVLGTALLGPALAAPVARAAGTPWAAKAAAGLAVLALLRILLLIATRQGRESTARAWSRVRHWEFWPSWLFNTPVAIWIACLAIRHRSLTTAMAANPGLPDGGVVGESKSAILALLPQMWVQPWDVVPTGALDTRMAQVAAILETQAWRYPIVAKPDVGERGTGVRWIASDDQMRTYLAADPRRVILQVAHDGPYEAGLFYVRFPHQPRGRLWSMTEKRFPEAVGDGRSTLAALIARHPRHRLQQHVYQARLGPALDRVPLAGERVALARAGNHCQGTQFLDGARLWTPALEARIDEIARATPGFYFGRFDVRYRDEDAFKAGEDLAILELNGLTSEATHIYDPRYSVWRAWQTLAAQWSMAFAIGAANRASGAPRVPLWRLAPAVWTLVASRPPHAIAD